MNLNEAINHASTIFMPEFMFGMGDDAYRAERATNEEALSLLIEEYFGNEKPGFDFGLVLDLAERNRQTCDMIESPDAPGDNSPNLPRALTQEDVVRGVAALQHRKWEKVQAAFEGQNASAGMLYASGKIKGTVLGIDIETTSRCPDRGRIINVGWELIDLERGAAPYDGHAVYCGLPEQYSAGVPLEEIHHIGWNDVAGKKPFVEDKELQEQLLSLMQKYPYMAHNAAFENAWFTLNLPGYAEGRKAHKITPVDTRDICRALDPDVRRLPWDSHPASLENWARRRNTLTADANEVHLGLDDTDLMLRTVIAEFEERNLL